MHHSERLAWSLRREGCRMRRPLSALLLLGALSCFFLPDIAAQATSQPWIVIVNGQALSLKTAPYLQANRMMVPARAIAQALGAEVAWDAARQEVLITDAGKAILLTRGSATSTITGTGLTPTTFYLSVPPTQVGGRIFVPLRFVAENLQATVQWDATPGTIAILRRTAATETNPSRGDIPSRTDLAPPVPEITITEKSTAGRAITFIYLGEKASVDKLAIIGSMHGDEPQGKYIVEQLQLYLSANPAIMANRQILLIPVLNPDGLAQSTRTNAYGVDLNRNFPTSNWGSGDETYGSRYFHGISPASEEETRLLIKHLTAFNPQLIINLHSPLRLVNYDGSGSAPIAEFLARFNRYEVTQDIGYPTPGSLGTYFGKELGIPTITLETGGDAPAIAWKENQEGLIQLITNLHLLLPENP